jgi:hypothetical protein
VGDLLTHLWDLWGGPKSKVEACGWKSPTQKPIFLFVDTSTLPLVMHGSHNRQDDGDVP